MRLEHPHDIPMVSGDSWSVRRSAQELRSTVGDLATARLAAAHIEAVTRGDHWQGEAFEAFRRVVDRQPITAAIDHAKTCMHEAADQLHWYAARLDEHQDELRWCRSRLASVLEAAATSRVAAEAAGSVVPDALDAEVVEIARRVDEVWRRHRWALEVVADTFDRLDDEPTFATPPPSTLDRATGALSGFVAGVANGAWSLTVGMAEGTRDLLMGLVEVARLLNPITLPGRLSDAWANREQIVAVLRHAWDHPGEFFGQLGRAMLDLDMLFEDPARWIGRRIPDVLLTVATGGMGRLGSSAASSARALRGARAADRMTDRVGLLSPLRPQGATTAAPRMQRANDLAAFHDTDTLVGRLAGRFDELGPGAQVLRQTPGIANEEVKGFTSIPRRLVQERLPDGSTSGRVLDHPIVQSSIDSTLSNGLTSQLGMLDGLLVGQPALSPSAQAGMVTLLGVNAFDQIAGIQELVGHVDAAAQPEPAR